MLIYADVSTHAYLEIHTCMHMDLYTHIHAYTHTHSLVDLLTYPPTLTLTHQHNYFLLPHYIITSCTVMPNMTQ